MDIHRCRFVPYPASPVNALAFSHETSKDRLAPSSLRLALGRANGDIEIWDPKNGIWAQELILRGGRGRSVEGLAWTHDLEEEGPHGEILPGNLRLFSIGYSNAVTEWDFTTGMPSRNSSGGSGESWCIATQPRWNKQRDGQNTRQDQLLAVGCSDGSVVLHSTEDGNLSYLRTLPRPSNLKARVLSITFKGRDTIVSGCSDGTIWIYDIRGGGKIKNTMSLGAGPKRSSSNILVWTVKAVGKNVLVSGDSNGELRFWDLKTATQLQRIKCHDADVHDVVLSADGTSLLSAGTDRKMCRLQYNRESRRWHRISHTRVHRNEVKVMAVLDSKELSFAVSGGSDSVPTVTPLERFGSEYHRSLPSFPNVPPIISAPSKRLLVTWWDREIHLCYVTADLLENERIRNPSKGFQDSGVMTKLLLQGEEAISSVTVTADGSQLLVGTGVGCKLFKLKHYSKEIGRPSKLLASCLKIRRQEIPSSLSECGAKHIQFSPNGKWVLVVKPNSRLFVYRIARSMALNYQRQVLENPYELHRREHQLPAISQPLDGVMGEYQKSVCRVAWSSDSQLIACADLSGYVDIWMLQGDEQTLDDTTGSIELPLTNGMSGHSWKGSDTSSDSSDDESIPEKSHKILGQFWMSLQSDMPKLPAFPLVLSFRPRTRIENTQGTSDCQPESISLQSHGRHKPHNAIEKLVVVTALHEIYEFEVLEGQFSDWSRRNPPSHFPIEFLKDKERAIGCIWDVHNKERLWIYSSTALWMFDMSRDFPQHVSTIARGSPKPETENKVARRAGMKRKRVEDEMLWQHAGHASGAGDRILSPYVLHGLGSDVRTATTHDGGTIQEASRLDFVDQGRFIGFSDQEEKWETFGPNKKLNASSTLALYRRINDKQEDTGSRTNNDDALTNGHFSNNVSTSDTGMQSGILHSKQYSTDGDGWPKECSDEKGHDRWGDTGVVPVSSKTTRKKRSIHFWRTYQYRPILGVVPLEKDASESITGKEDDEPVPDLEVALIERPLWETDLDLPWDSHP